LLATVARPRRGVPGAAARTDRLCRGAGGAVVPAAGGFRLRADLEPAAQRPGAPAPAVLPAQPSARPPCRVPRHARRYPVRFRPRGAVVFARASRIAHGHPRQPPPDPDEGVDDLSRRVWPALLRGPRAGEAAAAVPASLLSIARARPCRDA